MATCDWVLVCEHLIFDKLGKVSIIGVFNRINAKAVPTSFARISVVSDIQGEPEESVVVTVRLVGPNNGEPLFNRTLDKVSLSKAGGSYAAVTIENVMLPTFGTYHFEVLIGGTVAKSREFAVVHAKE